MRHAADAGRTRACDALTSGGPQRAGKARRRVGSPKAKRGRQGRAVKGSSHRQAVDLFIAVICCVRYVLVALSEAICVSSAL